ncbi:DUF6-domain-containing protein [Phellopilus nigrolimitatus]|nr:DUF6-domain-containing protein [Phellopilus nigrolimitatus]
MTLSGRYQPLSTDAPEALEIDGINASYTSSSQSSNVFWPITNLTNGISQKCISLGKTNVGLLLVAASQAFFALMNVAVKKLNTLDPPVPTLELVLVRMGITYICCISYMLWKRVPDPFLGPKDVRFLLVFRGFSGFFGLFGIYYSLQYLSLSDATVLTFLSPLTTALAGCLFLGEVFKRKEAIAGGDLTITVLRILFGSHSASSPTPGGVDPSERGTPGQRLGAVGVALVGVLGATGAYTSLRAIGKRAHTLHSLTFFSSQCVVAAIVGMLLLQEKVVFPTRIEWLALLVMIGIFGFLAQVLLTLGLQRETAGRGAMAIYVQIIFASILERIFFHTVPSTLSITGTLIIMGSAVYVAITKQSAQTSKSSVPGDPHANSEIALDLELGVAEPETQRFLAHDNISLPSILEDEGKKADTSRELDAIKSKSELSLASEFVGQRGEGQFAVGELEADSDPEIGDTNDHKKEQGRRPL